MDYQARRLVSVTEGGMYGPGDVIDGPFDPKDEHNAALIEAGSIRAFRGVVSKSEPEGDAQAPDEASAAENAGESAEGGGAASSATVEGVKRTGKAKQRRKSKESAE